MSCLFKRGLRNQFIQDVRPLNPSAGTMVGEAFTLRYMPAREDLNPMTVFQNPEHPQRKAVELCPPGAVLVMDSRKDPRAASAGSMPPRSSWPSSAVLYEGCHRPFLFLSARSQVVD